MKTILVVDDDDSVREFLEVLLRRRGHQVVTAASLTAALPLIDKADVIVSDFRLGRSSGIEVLQAARKRKVPPEVVIITAYGTPASAVEAMRAGAYDYIAKPFDNEEFCLLIERALEKQRLVSENEALRSSSQTYFLGISPTMTAVWSVVDKVAATRSTVLIVGESGTGKEVVARAIHTRSPRAGKPFVPVNCGAIAEGVLESELFGHVKGAFTGASSDRSGLLVSAGEGTVLLDEIGELPLGTQVKLLRVLQERRVRPVGSTQEVPFEARILAATNRSLEEDVKAGRFREDLLFRLNVITIEVPPLRARAEDIPALADFFLAQARNELGRPGLVLSDELRAVLNGYSFPGNVRQLQNLIQRAATLSDSDVLGVAELPPAVRGAELPFGTVTPLPIGPQFSLERHLDELENAYLLQALKASGGVKTKAAEMLGLTFRSLRYRLAKHGLS
jgi:two-component system response regulator PilR (NtrC family)